MSSPLPESLWIHIGECPCCVNGLCRVRFCQDDNGAHLYAMCDECESLWVEPTTDGPKCFPDIDDPRCPVCALTLYGPQAHWAEAQELLGTPWSEVAIFDLPAADSTSGEEFTGRVMPQFNHAAMAEQSVHTQDFLTTEDIADALDAPAILPAIPEEAPSNNQPNDFASPAALPLPEPVQQHYTVGEPLPVESDAAYGEDEPKPGC